MSDSGVPTIKEQIEFLKKCYQVSFTGLLRAESSGSPERIAQAEHSQRCLEETIRILEEMES